MNVLFTSLAAISTVVSNGQDAEWRGSNHTTRAATTSALRKSSKSIYLYYWQNGIVYEMGAYGSDVCNRRLFVDDMRTLHQCLVAGRISAYTHAYIDFHAPKKRVNCRVSARTAPGCTPDHFWLHLYYTKDGEVREMGRYDSSSWSQRAFQRDLAALKQYHSRGCISSFSYGYLNCHVSSGRPFCPVASERDMSGLYICSVAGRCVKSGRVVYGNGAASSRAEAERNAINQMVIQCFGPVEVTQKRCWRK